MKRRAFLAGAAGLLVAPAARSGQRPGQRKRGWRGACGWSDPTGLDWSSGGAWSLGGASGGDIEPLVGSVPLALDSGTYSPATAGPTLTPEGLGLDGPPQNIAGCEFSATIPSLAGATSVHMRLIIRNGSTFGGRIAQVGADADRHVFLSESFQAGRMLTRQVSTTGAAVNQRTYDVAGSTWFVADIVASDNGGSGSRLEEFINGSDDFSSSATAWAGLEGGEVELSGASWDGDVLFFGVRAGGLTLAQHDAAVDAVLDVGP